MSSFYDEALKVDEIEIKEILKGFVAWEGKGSFASVLLYLADLAKEEGESAALTDSPVDKLGKTFWNWKGKYVKQVNLQTYCVFKRGSYGEAIYRARKGVGSPTLQVYRLWEAHREPIGERGLFTPV